MKHSIFFLLFLFGCFFIFFSFQQYNQTKFLVETGITTKAVVIDLGEEHATDGYDYTPIYEYQDKNNNTIKFVSSTTSNSFSYNLGDSVEIIYIEDEPMSERTISFFDLYGLAIIYFIIGIIFFSVSTGYFLYVWKNRNKELR